jgi:aspartyl-tRNA(Asn)/glutamyl-tRNA(Gln) amidotransferase subunit A
MPVAAKSKTRTPLHFQSIPELGRQLREGALSPVALAETLLQRIERLNPKLHAFKALTRERALAEARAAEALLRAGCDLGPLHGIPYAVKDLYDVKGEATTAGSHLLEKNIAAQDCHAVRRLSQAGMVLLGKTHTVQFAFGGVGINHDDGTPHNPWSPVAHAPGGSSSGTGVAVAAGLVPMGLGSDTGGSVRIPSALNGVAGLKTTVGRIGRSGVYPLSWTHDSVGPLARTVEDCALAYSAMQGPDPADETTDGVLPHDVLSTLERGVKGLRLAFCETLFFDDVDKEVVAAVRGTAAVFEKLGAHVGSIEAPEIAESFSFGRRDLFTASEALLVNGTYIDEHFDELDPVVAHRMIRGKTMLATDYFALRRKWAGLQRTLLATLRDVDALLLPTCLVPARPLEVIDADKDVYAQYNLKYLRNTAVGNVLGLCALSVPCGFDSTGMPIGLMIYAKPFAEDVALRVAHAYERASEWNLRHPDLEWAE